MKVLYNTTNSENKDISDKVDWLQKTTNGALGQILTAMFSIFATLSWFVLILAIVSLGINIYKKTKVKDATEEKQIQKRLVWSIVLVVFAIILGGVFTSLAVVFNTKGQ